MYGVEKQEKIVKYQDLVGGKRRLCEVSPNVIPGVCYMVGSLGAVINRLRSSLIEGVALTQKYVLFITARIIRKAFDI